MCSCICARKASALREFITACCVAADEIEELEVEGKEVSVTFVCGCSNDENEDGMRFADPRSGCDCDCVNASGQEAARTKADGGGGIGGGGSTA